MCKGNKIITSWSWIGACISIPIVVAGFLASYFGAELTWGEFVIIPFIVTAILNIRHEYSFSEKNFAIERKRLLSKHIVPAEEIQQIEVFTTKSGTWIVIKKAGAPDILPYADRKDLLLYRLKNRRTSYLIPLQWGERDKALAILREFYSDKIVIVS